MKKGSIILTSGNPYGMGTHMSMGIISAPARNVRGKLRLPISVAVQPGDKGGPVFDISGKVVGIIDSVVHNSHKNNFIWKDKNGWTSALDGYTKKMKEKSDLGKAIDIEVDEYIEELQEKYIPKRHRKKINKALRDIENETNKIHKSIEKVVKQYTSDYKPKFSMGVFVPDRSQGVNLAIPINEIKSIIEQLKVKKVVDEGWLGVAITTIPEAMRYHLPELEDNVGVQVRNVVQDSPAQKAGIKKWDIIVSFAGELITDHATLKRLVAKTVGTTTITIIRRKEKMTLDVEVARK